MIKTVAGGNVYVGADFILDGGNADATTGYGGHPVLNPWRGRSSEKLTGFGPGGPSTAGNWGIGANYEYGNEQITELLPGSSGSSGRLYQGSGAGGGGLAIVYALVQEGLKQIFITNRSQERAEQIADIFKDEHIIVRPWSDRHSLVAESELIVNTTSQGMAGQTPLDLSLELAKLDAIVADIIYVPLETALICDAKSRGLRTVGGLGMLLHHSRPAWQLWFGIDPHITSHLRSAMERDINLDSQS